MTCTSPCVYVRPMSEEENTDTPAEKKAMTPGQRLAASKAAKAAHKAAERGRQAEQIEDKALEKVDEARNWLVDNAKTLLVGGAALMGVVALVSAWNAFDTSKAQDAGAVLWTATEALQADVGDNAIDTDGELSFKTTAERSAAALKSFNTLQQSHKGADATGWASLGEGRAHADVGAWDKAAAAYERTISSAGGDQTITLGAIDGLVGAYEALGKNEEALSKLGALKNLGKSVSPIVAYHEGRILYGQGKKTEAKAKLQDVLSQLKADGAPELSFTESQTETLLSRLDPTRVKTPTFDPAELQRLLQAQQQGLGQ